MLTRVVLLFGVIALLAGACGDDSSQPEAPTRAPDSTGQTTSTPTGPRIVLEPAAGPPGIEITVRGFGWEPGVLVDVTGELAPGVTADPYETVVPGADGSFTASFRLEKTPDGGDLSTGRFDLIVRSSSSQVAIPFIVETRRPVGSSGPSG